MLISHLNQNIFLKRKKNNHPRPIGVIILAAGASRRMGRPKQLLKIGNQTLIERAIELTQGVGLDQTVIVLGANAEKMEAVIKKEDHFSIVLNKDWAKGMGTTLRTGLQFLLETNPKLEAVIIMVCDQPYLTREILQELINTYDKERTEIVTAQYGEVAGVPAIFSKKLFSKLMALKEDEGARKIIKRYKGSIATIDFPKGAIDLDTPEAYQKFLKATIKKQME